MLKKSFASLAAFLVLTIPAGNLWAASHYSTKTPKKRVIVVKKTVLGPKVPCLNLKKRSESWGPMQVKITVQRTTTLRGTKKIVKLKILKISTPVYPTSSDRAAYINSKALPLLEDEVMEIQSDKIEMISGATDTSVAFKKSLQGALLRAKK